MDQRLLDQYAVYKRTANLEAGQELAHYVYHQLSQWLEQGRPDPGMLAVFDSFFKSIEKQILDAQDLIDLGLIHTAEAIMSYHAEEESDQLTRFYLSEARLPFFAAIDENAYRMLKNFEFSEIDFQIFEIIGNGTGRDFPHDAAQNFLMDNEWVDIWVALRYLDSLPEAEPDLELIERILASRETLHEQLILFAYLCMIAPELIAESTEGAEPPERVRFNFPAGLSRSLCQAVFALLQGTVEDGELNPAFEFDARLAGAGSHRQACLFALLVYFEIVHASLLPGWIRLLEIGIRETWTTRSLEDGQEILYQPITEFTASILGLLSDEDLRFLLDTSLLLPGFFEALPEYNPEAFQSLLMALSRETEIFHHELELALPKYIEPRPAGLHSARLQSCAEMLGFEIQIEPDGRPVLVPGEFPDPPGSAAGSDSDPDARPDQP